MSINARQEKPDDDIYDVWMEQKPVYASDMNKECVDETAKDRHEFECPRCGHCCREWVGLTKDEVDSWELPVVPTVFQFAQFVETKLKEKNT